MRTNFKRGAAATLAAATVLLASGCMSLDADLTLDRDAKASGQMEITFNKQIASLGGISSTDDLKEQLEAETDSESDPIPDGVGAYEVSETDTDYVVTIKMDDVVLDSSEFLAKKDEATNTVTFTLVNDGEEGAEMFADSAKADVTVNFPGEVKTFSGPGATKVDSDTVQWKFPFMENATLTATSDIAPASSGSAAILIGFAALILGGILVGGLVLVRRKTLSERVATEPTEPGTTEQVDA